MEVFIEKHHVIFFLNYLLWFHRTSLQLLHWQCLLPSTHWYPSPVLPVLHQRWVWVPRGFHLYPARNIGRQWLQLIIIFFLKKNMQSVMLWMNFTMAYTQHIKLSNLYWCSVCLQSDIFSLWHILSIDLQIYIQFCPVLNEHLAFFPFNILKSLFLKNHCFLSTF